nr:hypothetical protein [uncultured Ruegeria sp.]
MDRHYIATSGQKRQPCKKLTRSQAVAALVVKGSQAGHLNQIQLGARALCRQIGVRTGWGTTAA